MHFYISHDHAGMLDHCAIIPYQSYVNTIIYRAHQMLDLNIFTACLFGSLHCAHALAHYKVMLLLLIHC